MAMKRPREDDSEVSAFYTRGVNWDVRDGVFTNGRGEEIRNPSKYFDAVAENERGFNDEYTNGRGETIHHPKEYFETVVNDPYGYNNCNRSDSDSGEQNDGVDGREHFEEDSEEDSGEEEGAAELPGEEPEAYDQEDDEPGYDYDDRSYDEGGGCGDEDEDDQNGGGDSYGSDDQGGNSYDESGGGASDDGGSYSSYSD
eukprot:2830516-Rhodomonas_salina.2